jgi:ABC-2 type transport system ATP-binding protein
LYDDFMTAIAIRDLVVRRGGHDVVRCPALDVDAGAVTGLMGPSGCGKTTLMRSVVGVQRIVAGEVRVLGRPAGSAGLRSRVGYMTQAPSVYGDLTVRENLRFFARVLGAPERRIDEVVDAVAVPARAGQLVRDLSGGERARVSLATVLLGEPELLILDEPTRGVDPERKQQLARLLRADAPTRGTIVVTHDLPWAAEVADRVVELAVREDVRV